MDELNPSHNNWETNISCIMWQGSMPTIEELKDRRREKQKKFISLSNVSFEVYSAFTVVLPIVYSGVLPIADCRQTVITIWLLCLHTRYTWNLTLNIWSSISDGRLMLLWLLLLLRYCEWFDGSTGLSTGCYLFYGIYFCILLITLFLNIRFHSVSVWTLRNTHRNETAQEYSVAVFLRCFISILVFSSIINCPCNIFIVSWI